ncbi:MAG: RidA family protein [Puniceicoccales bacterium]
MQKQRIEHPSVTAEFRGISPAVRVGDQLFISGQGPLDLRDKSVLSGTIEEETLLTLSYIRDLVLQAGGTLENIVKCTTYLADLDDFNGYHKTYVDFFRDVSIVPARTTVQADLLRGIRIEIDAIAILPSTTR